jgi:hypothetical protein
MKTPTIYDIKYDTLEKCPHFFSRDTLKFFGQTMKSFIVKKSPTGRIFIYAPIRDYRGKQVGITFREFTGNDLVNFDLNTIEEIEQFIQDH